MKCGVFRRNFNILSNSFEFVANAAPEERLDFFLFPATGLSVFG